MAVAITKVKTNYKTTEVVISGLGNGPVNSPPFLSEGLPYGSAMVTVTGTAPTSVTLQGSGDGVNFVGLGTPATVFPAMTPLLVSVSDAPAKWYRFAVAGGDGTTSITITVILMGAY